MRVEEVGVLYGVLGFIILLSAYNDLGMTESLKYFIPKFIIKDEYNKIKSIIVYSFLVQVCTGLIFASLFYFGSTFLATHYFGSSIATDVLKVFSVYFLGLNIFQVAYTVLLSLQKTFETKLLDFIRLLGVAVFTILLYLFDGGSLYWFSISQVVGLYGGIITAILIFYNRVYRKYLSNSSITRDPDLIKQVFGYAFTVFLGTSVGTILGQIDLQMVLYLLGPEQGGYYTNYLSLLGITGIIIGPILLVVFPIISDLHARGNTKGIATIKEFLVNNFIIVSIACSSFFFALSGPITSLLFGSNFAISGDILQYSIVFVVFSFLLQTNMNILAGIGKVKERMKIVYIAVVTNLVLNYIFISLIGVYGAALATAFGRIIMRGLGENVLNTSYKYSIVWKSVIKNLLIFISLGIIASYYIPIVELSASRKEKLFVICIIGLVFGSIFLLTNREEISQYRKLV